MQKYNCYKAPVFRLKKKFVNKSCMIFNKIIFRAIISCRNRNVINNWPFVTAASLNRGISQSQEHSANKVKMKYILVTGGVISGVGKGVIASSFGTLLNCCGISVTSLKIDPYINIDAGTFSPYEHG